MADDIDTEDNISTLAEFREILQIPGYRLSKPLEIQVIGQRERGVCQYIATHYLPSERYENGAPKGTALIGRGETPEEAGDQLCKTIVFFWNLLKDAPKEILSPNRQLQQDYLRTLFLK